MLTMAKGSLAHQVEDTVRTELQEEQEVPWPLRSLHRVMATSMGLSPL
jgi:hypothetical protein